MANITDVKTLYNGDGRHGKVIHMVGVIDTAETDVAKVDISTYTTPLGATPTYTVIDKIEYSVGGAGYVLLEWDGDTDDEIAVLTGQGCIDWTSFGGKVDPRTAGGTGDILLTTAGTAAAISATNIVTYDIVLYLRMKA